MVVLAHTRKRDHILGGYGSLMSQCLVAGLPVASSCAGRGACAKCVVMVLEGQEFLVPPEAQESLVLARNLTAPGVRLSCQCQVRYPGERVVITTGYW